MEARCICNRYAVFARLYNTLTTHNFSFYLFFYCRLEGEKKGLEKVLEVKAGFNGDQSLSSFSHVSKDRNRRNEGKRNGGNGSRTGRKENDRQEGKEEIDSEQGDDEDDDDAEKEEIIKEREKESIEKIVQEHIEKLGITNQTNKAVVPAAVMPIPLLSPYNMQSVLAAAAAAPQNQLLQVDSQQQQQQQQQLLNYQQQQLNPLPNVVFPKEATVANENVVTVTKNDLASPSTITSIATTAADATEKEANPTTASTQQADTTHDV